MAQALRFARRSTRVREFELGRFEIVHIGGMAIGRATYQPGWKWSLHVGAALGQESFEVEHVCMAVSGRGAVAFDNGEVTEVRPGDVFYVPPGPPGHDSWKTIVLSHHADRSEIH